MTREEGADDGLLFKNVRCSLRGRPRRRFARLVPVPKNMHSPDGLSEFPWISQQIRSRADPFVDKVRTVTFRYKLGTPSFCVTTENVRFHEHQVADNKGVIPSTLILKRFTQVLLPLSAFFTTLKSLKQASKGRM
ncbi:hypothetical protein EVAR_103758_1 [Eumeta japonica]|uniref:Uncharacterized protein n=1 Tax=Eumeta variegata TaxID=151549 RepID=A0A4C2A4Z9_EUMVA|nr:hypothetical protein EVAR_103758_1 [Eumeta japonica]